jgi:hypothetical protein
MNRASPDLGGGTPSLSEGNLMNGPAPETTFRVILSDDEGIGHVSVPADSFLVLNVWMDQQLKQLEERFVHFQTPMNFSRRRNFRPS